MVKRRKPDLDENGQPRPKRPACYWQFFNNWWRERHAELLADTEIQQKRPGLDMIRKFHAQWAAKPRDQWPLIWQAEGFPPLDAMETHSKGLRSLKDLQDFFREYRAAKREAKGEHHPVPQAPQEADEGEDSEGHAAPRKAPRTTICKAKRTGREPNPTSSDQVQQQPSTSSTPATPCPAGTSPPLASAASGSNSTAPAGVPSSSLLPPPLPFTAPPLPGASMSLQQDAGLPQLQGGFEAEACGAPANDGLMTDDDLATLITDIPDLDAIVFSEEELAQVQAVAGSEAVELLQGRRPGCSPAMGPEQPMHQIAGLQKEQQPVQLPACSPLPPQQPAAMHAALQPSLPSHLQATAPAPVPNSAPSASLPPLPCGGPQPTMYSSSGLPPHCSAYQVPALPTGSVYAQAPLHATAPQHIYPPPCLPPCSSTPCGLPPIHQSSAPHYPPSQQYSQHHYQHANAAAPSAPPPLAPALPPMPPTHCAGGHVGYVHHTPALLPVYSQYQSPFQMAQMQGQGQAPYACTCTCTPATYLAASSTPCPPPSTAQPAAAAMPAHVQPSCSGQVPGMTPMYSGSACSWSAAPPPQQCTTQPESAASYHRALSPACSYSCKPPVVAPASAPAPAPAAASAPVAPAMASSPYYGGSAFAYVQHPPPSPHQQMHEQHAHAPLPQYGAPPPAAAPSHVVPRPGQMAAATAPAPCTTTSSAASYAPPLPPVAVMPALPVAAPCYGIGAVRIEPVTEEEDSCELIVDISTRAHDNKNGCGIDSECDDIAWDMDMPGSPDFTAMLHMAEEGDVKGADMMQQDTATADGQPWPYTVPVKQDPQLFQQQQPLGAYYAAQEQDDDALEDARFEEQVAQMVAAECYGGYVTAAM